MLSFPPSSLFRSGSVLGQSEDQGHLNQRGYHDAQSRILSSLRGRRAGQDGGGLREPPAALERSNQDLQVCVRAVQPSSGSLYSCERLSPLRPAPLSEKRHVQPQPVDIRQTRV